MSKRGQRMQAQVPAVLRSRRLPMSGGAVEENLSTDLPATPSGIAGKSGFAPMRRVIEVHGQCASRGSTEGRA